MKYKTTNAQVSVPVDIQRNAYFTTKDTITSAPLAILLTLLTISGVTAFFLNYFFKFVNQEVWLSVKSYLVSQTEAVRTFSETSKDATKLISQIDS
uniref:hypothetical protein n=1 Tax=Nodularia chucula TaxID=3093667 RepID=UPI0039C5D591